MSLLVDGYNVLHCTHLLPDRWSQIGPRDLCMLIARAKPRGGAQVIFDGAPPHQPGSHPTRSTVQDVEIIYAGGGNDADSLIERIIEEHRQPRGLLVISNDRRLQAAARRRGATPAASEDFLRQLVAALKPNPRPDAEKPAVEGDVQGWLHRFGLTTGQPPDAADEDDGHVRHWLDHFGFDPDGHPRE